MSIASGLLDRPLGPKTRCFLRAGIVWLIGLVFYFGHGIVFHLTPWAQAIISAVTSIGYSTAHYEKTVVVVFTEKDLDDEAQGVFPVSYATHARVLEAIASYEPRAIFIDFAFVQAAKDRNAVKQRTASDFGLEHRIKEFSRLAETISKLDAQGIKVFYVDPSQVGIGTLSEDPFNLSAQRVGAAIDREDIASGVLRYPMFSSIYDKERTDRDHVATCIADKTIFSAAVALWMSAFPKEAVADECKRMGERMAVIWPAMSPPYGKYANRCETPAHVSQPLQELYFHGPDRLKRNCPYSITYTVGDLLHPNENFVEPPAGATVFYGGSLGLATDLIRSPAFVALPAVHYHAVAYDNLLAFEGHPKQVLGHGFDTLVALLLLPLTYWFAARPHAHRPHGANLLRRCLRIALVATVAVVAIAAFVLWEIYLREVKDPEWLILGCFMLFVAFRIITNPTMAVVAIVSFGISIWLFFIHYSFDHFLSVILFFEVVHWTLERFQDTASRLHSHIDQDARVAMSLPQKLMLKFFEPFLSITKGRS